MRTTKKEKLATLRQFHNVTGIYSVNGIEIKHKGHFFSPGSMRFFNSRLCHEVFPTKNGAYFITSEKFDYKSPRLYTVRFFDLNDDIKTVGEFQAFETKAQAVSFAIDCAYNDVQGV